MSDVGALLERFGLNPPTEVTPIGGGLTNTNHLVTIDGERFVVRGGPQCRVARHRPRRRGTGRPGRRRGGHRCRDRRTAPRGSHGDPVHRGQGLLARRVRVRGRGASGGGDTGPGPHTRADHRCLRSHGAHQSPSRHRGLREGPVPGGLVEGVRRVEEIVARRVAEPRVLCHNDPYFTNFIDDGAALRLIDWEYAGMGDALYDLAGVAYALDAPKRAALLDAYDGQVDDGRLKDLSDLVMVFLLWNVAWALVQIDDSDVDHDYEGMAFEFVGLMEREAGPV